MMAHLLIYLLTSVLIGVNGPFPYTERFEQLEDCLRAKIYYHVRGQWAGGCRRVTGKVSMSEEEREKA